MLKLKKILVILSVSFIGLSVTNCGLPRQKIQPVVIKRDNCKVREQIETSLLSMGQHFTDFCIKASRSSVYNLHWYKQKNLYCISQDEYNRLITGLNNYDYCLSKINFFLKAMQKIEQAAEEKKALKQD